MKKIIGSICIIFYCAVCTANPESPFLAPRDYSFFYVDDEDLESKSLYFTILKKAYLAKNKAGKYILSFNHDQIQSNMKMRIPSLFNYSIEQDNKNIAARNKKNKDDKTMEKESMIPLPPFTSISVGDLFLSERFNWNSLRYFSSSRGGNPDPIKEPIMIIINNQAQPFYLTDYSKIEPGDWPYTTIFSLEPAEVNQPIESTFGPALIITSANNRVSLNWIMTGLNGNANNIYDWDDGSPINWSDHEQW